MSDSNPLRRARTRLGLTQEEMARALRLSRSTYQRREALGDEYIPFAEKAAARALVHAEVDVEIFGEEGFVIEWISPAMEIEK